ncbi:MAG: phosphotransferase family protein [Gammaproteobacteria bacterium]|nr:phosphotransferase family protein [Gammaproteobacteria bacterium]MDH3464771.1 phosphotransferase family protein [Gammaproteobacteria bacterium]
MTVNKTEITDAELKRLKEVIASVPLLKPILNDDPDIERSGGLTNRNYLVNVGADRYVLRVPGEGTDDYMDRASDEYAARITSDLGVNAELVYYQTGTGVQLTRLVENADTLTPESFRDLELARRAGRLFATVHNSGKSFLTDFNDLEVGKEYLGILKQMNGDFPDGYDEIQKEAIVVREALATKAGPLVPSHNDPVPENFINTPERMYLLDWEFGGNNDCMWDLGDLSVEGYFTEEQDRAMLEAYLDGGFSEQLYSRMILQKSMVFLLWTLWGALQVANKNPLNPRDIHYPFDDFWEYTMNRFTRCQEIMNSDSFGSHLENVKK